MAWIKIPDKSAFAVHGVAVSRHLSFQMVEHCVFEAKQKDRFTCFLLLLLLLIDAAAGGAAASVVHYYYELHGNITHSFIFYLDLARFPSLLMKVTLPNHELCLNWHRNREQLSG